MVWLSRATTWRVKDMHNKFLPDRQMAYPVKGLVVEGKNGATALFPFPEASTNSSIVVYECIFTTWSGRLVHTVLLTH